MFNKFFHQEYHGNLMVPPNAIPPSKKGQKYIIHMIMKAVFLQTVALGVYRPYTLGIPIKSIALVKHFCQHTKKLMSIGDNVSISRRIHVLHICHYLPRFTFNPNAGKHYTWTLGVLLRDVLRKNLRTGSRCVHFITKQKQKHLLT